MADRGLNLLDECAARCLHPSPQEEECTFFPEGIVKYTHLAEQQIYRGCQLK